jgi:hypothetical protein
MALKFSKGYTSMQTRHVRYENVTELMDRRKASTARGSCHWYPASRSNWVINPNNTRFVPGNPKSVDECPDEATRKLFYKRELLGDKRFPAGACRWRSTGRRSSRPSTTTRPDRRRSRRERVAVPQR